MKRRYFLQTSGAASATLLAGCKTSTPANEKKINILFIMDDQHRGDCIGAAGADWLDTPNLDRLANEGAMFTRSYSSMPSCLPARAGILTGLRPWNHGLLSFLTIPNKYRVEMPQLFTDGGYRTHVAGKNHFYGAKHGYQTCEVEEIDKRLRPDGLYRDDYMRWMQLNHPDKHPKGGAPSFTDHRGNRPWPYEEAIHPTTWTAERAKAFLREYDGDAPWFLKFSCHRPHPPFDAPKRLMNYYKAKELPQPVVGDWAKEQFSDATGSIYNSPSSGLGHYSVTETHDSRAAYYASITHVDEKIGEVLQVLEERGELENTLILFTADHGDMMGDHHHWRKVYAYEPSAHIPMIIRWPSALHIPMERGQKLDHLVELRDIMPTFLDAAGLPIPNGLDGESMINILRNPDCTWREVLDLEHSSQYFSEQAYVALTDKQYKYIRFMQTGKEQLFDLMNDPMETKNISDPKRLTAWRKRMIAFLEERGEEWVKDGELVLQTRRMRYGPNFAKQMIKPADPECEVRFNPPYDPVPLAEYLKRLKKVEPYVSADPNAQRPA
ncbi:arylsulfatase [Pontiella sulfatireligans]|uniref:Arylsulfatase n=1 Tax=Pontiella sulfatireligans TaxID=2750658 RepID=A0A6C2UPX1_9BACT|nr:arylsulfatase [Pontiella sulfatireligans]SPS74498.1 sulfatase S1_46 [Kiritimatiellales bacterium]VGO22325.1 Arylsulfatase [Pontiella sulfatireligans]